ncbi:MAG: response regulator [Acidobacteriota bacterium]
MIEHDSSKVILLVDDNAMNLELLSSILEEKGYQVRVATNGRRGLEAARRAKPDLIMLDVSMPDMDGYEVCRTIKADPQLRPVPVIFISAHDAGAEKAKAFEVGGADYVQKPFQIQEVLVRVRHQLRLASLQAALQEQNTDLEQANARLQEMVAREEQSHERLEALVVERTAELEERMAALEMSEERYRVLVETAPEAIIVFDADTQLLVDANPNAERLFGCGREQLIGTDITRFYPDPQPDERPLSLVPQDHLAADSQPIQFERVIRADDGTIRRCEVHVSRLPARDRRLVRGTLIDITERRIAEEKLRASESRLRAILDSTLDAVIVMDADGRVVELNPAAERHFGYASAAAVGKPIAELVNLPGEAGSSAAALTPYLMDSSASRLGQRVETTALRRNGHAFPVELCVQRIGSEAPPLFTAIVRDLTERKRLEAQFLQAQRMETVGQLAGGIAHDFNNLLTVINNSAELAAMELRAGDPMLEDLTAIVDAGKRAAVLTGHLLAFSRKQVLQPAVLNLNTLVKKLEGMLRRVIPENIELAINIAGNLDNVNVDRGQMEQVILNLAVNSRDAMPDGGTLTIETRQVVLDSSSAQTHPGMQPGPHVVLTVRDTGCGMDQATMQRMFEPFFTTKGVGRGTGLGLATVHGIIKQSGGDVQVFSELGHGSTVEMFLPAVTNMASGEQHTSAVKVARGTETILVVDDDAGICRVVKQMLESAGYRVLTASSTRDALLLLDRQARPPDLLLTDMVMPEMTGPELAERVIAACPEIKVLYASGYTDDAIMDHGAIAKGVHFIGKPYTTTGLTHKVREVLDTPTQAFKTAGA